MYICKISLLLILRECPDFKISDKNVKFSNSENANIVAVFTTIVQPSSHFILGNKNDKPICLAFADTQMAIGFDDIGPFSCMWLKKFNCSSESRRAKREHNQRHVIKPEISNICLLKLTPNHIHLWKALDTFSFNKRMKISKVFFNNFIQKLAQTRSTFNVQSDQRREMTTTTFIHYMSLLRFTEFYCLAFKSD